MKKITLSLFTVAALAFSGQMFAQEAEIDPNYNQNPTPGNSEVVQTGTHYQVAGGVIYSNGPGPTLAKLELDLVVQI